ncbi:UDP-N-acetylmuramoyl-tripeptide--D-alanyl-D-alanine ligase [Clostridium tetani]|uniref:UDP-N-acetylmuramoyl-tripeptide--D-alanyl-D- alanine ligase n=1 Tax=Clostridium tetani TaxID=1513 RepID=UPI000D21AEFC|nr:UDP-N-acetylmuramoyl-tripeptide--D-alanyl-D-alanine ligase [Clostridium tetani]AVP54170.1 UDP-N-acetylmuramoyl-tripeptide--D-alanyl-D-alanine ligase [Clostridium tetani]RXI76305.1 UDP-N-acetylmuramoyl-tripeptide--D-alanyl-D-alanine ligase [Clostridium tetani]RXM68219.1 UDP-N-acetylmuramoyl-tripeptide--D-alanyl-D-alanine ligase [Clostridium tetani]WFN60973.1 UDP-N-acetylmuramoyl-tripeptide--D-alanyl-D-alanine ligase [Clostridium tetani]SUY56135.1 UDP-N-acetylmuramoylalanyl-D-glutamyl-2, 6-di
MEYLSLEEIVKAVSGEILIKGNELGWEYISTDTRKIEEKAIFIALKGERFNGNEYTASASQKGAFICIVDEVHFKKEEIKDYTTVIKVKDTSEALLDLAKYYKSKLEVKVVAITGSTGKTSTKDLTASVLGAKYKVFKTEGNFNNEIGLPLMIFKLDKTYDIAVLEMGMSNFGEIHKMAKTALPDVAIITNIGISHIENLKSQDNILKAKLEITDFFGENNILIVNGEDDLLGDLKEEKYKLIKTGLGKNHNIYAYDINLNEKSVSFKVFEEGNELQIDIPVPGKHNVLNSLLAIACGRIFKISFEDIKKGLLDLQTTSMRLDMVEGKKFNIVDDSYNASPDSMKAAIEVLCNIKSKRKFAVLGTMKELGEEAYRAHREIGKYAGEKSVNLIVLGSFSKAYIEGYLEGSENKNNRGNILEAKDKEEVINYLDINLNSEDVVLFKASRSEHFEEMVESFK